MKNSQTIKTGSITALWLTVFILNLVILPRRLMLVADAAAVNPAALELVVRAPGTLQPKRSQTFKAEIDGPVLFKGFEEGKPVEEKQKLLEIGRDRIQLDYTSKVTAVKNGEADFRAAQGEVKLQKALFKRQAVAFSSVKEAEKAVVRAQQNLSNAKAVLRMAQELWNKNVISAAFKGVVLKDFIGDEKNVSAGKEIVTVADVSDYTVKALVDELQISQIREGQEAAIGVQAYEGIPLAGRVMKVGGQAEGEGIPQIPIFLAVTDRQNLPLLPKLTADIRIKVGETEPVLSVPLTALVNQSGDPKVWIVDGSRRLRLRSVTLGRSNAEKVEVVQGLEKGERVCLSADPRFAAGLKVRIK